MSNKKLLKEELNRMKTLAGILSENNESSDKTFLKEEILELKQMSKQLYSFLKSKGFPVELTNKIKEPIMPQNPESKGTITRDKQSVKSDINVETVQIQVTEGKDENVIVAVTPSNVARVIVGGGNDWSHKASAKFGNDWGTWQKNPEIVNYVNKLGNELLAQIKSKYPNMVYQFAQEPFYYVLKFGYAQTKKGGQLDPNKVKNPAPQQQGAPEQKVAAESVKKGFGKKTIKEDSVGTDKETLTTPVKTPPKTTPGKKENPLKIPKPGPGTRPNPKAFMETEGKDIKENIMTGTQLGMNRDEQNMVDSMTKGLSQYKKEAKKSSEPNMVNQYTWKSEDGKEYATLYKVKDDNSNIAFFYRVQVGNEPPLSIPSKPENWKNQLTKAIEKLNAMVSGN